MVLCIFFQFSSLLRLRSGKRGGREYHSEFIRSPGRRESVLRKATLHTDAKDSNKPLQNKTLSIAFPKPLSVTVSILTTGPQPVSEHLTISGLE